MTIARSAVRPCAAIAGSVLAFALLIERAGYLPAVLATVLIAASGSRELSVRDALMLAVALAVLLALLFVRLLNQPLDLLAWF